jgi:hypothetical protein
VRERERVLPASHSRVAAAARVSSLAAEEEEGLPAVRGGARARDGGWAKIHNDRTVACASLEFHFAARF